MNVYVVGTESGTGKSVIALGVMQLLDYYNRKVGFFRPITRDGEKDSLIHLIKSQFHLSWEPEEMYGCDLRTAGTMIAAGQQEELAKQIMDKFKAMADACHSVLLVGTDFDSLASHLEFDANLQLINHLGCVAVPVVNGADKDTEEIEISARLILDTFSEAGCETLAVVVNRVQPECLADVRKACRETFKDQLPVYALPDAPLLSKPTVAEIARSLGASVLSSGVESMGHEVRDYKIAAMEIPAFLESIVEGNVVLTPSDRYDIIMASLLAYESRNYPRLSGLILTESVQPDEQAKALIGGIPSPRLPILRVEMDTFEAASRIGDVSAVIAPESKRKIAVALGLMETAVNLTELEQRARITRPKRVTPLMFQYDLIRRAENPRKHIVLPEGTDERILHSAEILSLRNVVELTVLGNRKKVSSLAESLGLSLHGVNIVDPRKSDLRKKYADNYYELRKHRGITRKMALETMEDVSYFGTMMVQMGDVDGMVSGAANTTQHTIRPAFEFVRTKPGCSIVSSVFFMCLEDRVLVYGDCAVNPSPNAQELADIAVSSAETAAAFGVEPRVAMLSYSTGDSGKGEDVEKVREATRLAQEARPDLNIEGPIQYDAAVDPDVAASKMPDSKVAGKATVLIFPDLNTGNNTYKAVQRSANAIAIGPVLQGLNKPVNDLSRGCLVEDIVNTVAITAIQAQLEG